MHIQFNTDGMGKDSKMYPLILSYINYSSAKTMEASS